MVRLGSVRSLYSASLLVSGLHLVVVALDLHLEGSTRALVEVSGLRRPSEEELRSVEVRPLEVHLLGKCLGLHNLVSFVIFYSSLIMRY